VTDRVKPEWTCYDPKTDEMLFVVAEDQRSAIKKALQKGITPQDVHDVRPRLGDTEIMTREEFKAFMSKVI